ncbi:MAG: hypothetical protein ACE5G2_07835, partial [Candidatus Krumholzibacteriia bacterium]
DDPNVKLVTIERLTCTGLVARSQQRFHVDDNGTADPQDDRIRSYWSLVELQNGTQFEVSMQPVDGGFIVDNSLVDVSETIRHPFGLVSSQSNAIRLDVGLVETDGDEIIWTLSSEVAFSNGASASMVVDEVVAGGEPDGITDGDRVAVTSVFTAAPSNSRLESVTSTVEILVGVLNDEGDDLVASLSRTTVFDGETAAGGSPTASMQFVPSEPVGPGEEPCGGTFTKTAVFPADWDAQTFDRTITKLCEGGGSSQLDVTFSDGTSLSRTITWSGQGQVTLDAIGRDGTIVQGSFDEQGDVSSFEIDTTFPEGNDPVSTHQAGTSDRAAGTRSYTLVATFADGHQESLEVEGQRNPDGSRSLSGTVVDQAGTTTFQMDWDPETQTLSGSTQGPDDESSSFTLARQDDGGAVLDFTWADPSEDLTVTGHADINPDGSGCGEITVSQAGSTITVPFCFDADGSGYIGRNNPIPF